MIIAAVIGKIECGRSENEGLSQQFHNCLVFISPVIDKDNPPVVPDCFDSTIEKEIEVFIEKGGYLSPEDLLKIGVVFYAKANYTKALSYFQVALDQAQQANDSVLLAHSNGNIGSVYQAIAQFKEAFTHLEDALTIAQEIGDPQIHATALNNLAVLYLDIGRYAEAELLCKRALAIDEKALGKDHPDVARDLNNLAGLYRATGRYAEAEPLYLRALVIIEKALPPDHPHLAMVLEHMAELYRETGKNKEAERLEKRVREIRAQHKQQEGGG